MFPFVTLSLAFLFFALTIGNFLVFDQLIRLEYKHHKSDWQKDGKPIGYFWGSKETSYWSGAIARNGVAYKWYFETPEWMQSNPKAQRLVVWYRWTSRIAPFAWLILVIYMITFYECNK